jgi:hypothetical protein
MDIGSSIIDNINQIRSTEGNSVTIVCDNPDADSVDEQAAVAAIGDFTRWEEKRWYGRTWADALQKAADESRAFDETAQASVLARQRDDLALLVVRLARAIRSGKDGRTLAAQAMDYIQRHRLAGSILREVNRDGKEGS